MNFQYIAEPGFSSSRSSTASPYNGRKAGVCSTSHYAWGYDMAALRWKNQFHSPTPRTSYRKQWAEEDILLFHWDLFSSGYGGGSRLSGGKEK
jgi:hypothetical protein